ncbi:MAG: pentapeptide repeat-containing protein [Pseudomonadota bacterium]
MRHDEPVIEFAGQTYNSLTLPMTDDQGELSPKAHWDDEDYQRLFLSVLIKRLKEATPPRTDDGKLAQPGQPADFRNVVFPRAVLFDGTGFPLYADFTGAQFFGDFHLSGQHLAMSVDGCLFAGNFHAKNAHLLADLSAVRARFLNKVTLRECALSGDGYFQNATFERKATFSDTVFARSVAFNNARFAAPALFSRTQFGARAYFTRTRFEDFADFSYTEFQQYAYFSQCDFLQGASFQDARFHDRSFFSPTVGWAER